MVRQTPSVSSWPNEALFGPLPSREPEGLRRGFDATRVGRSATGGDGNVMGFCLDMGLT